MTLHSSNASLATFPAEIGDAARRVLIIDDHPIVREGLRRIIQDERDLVVCGDTGMAGDAGTAILQWRPDVLICDIHQKHANGIDLVRYVRAHHPRLPILVLTNADESVFAERMLAMGANGYITKHASGEELLASLRRVLDGHIAVSGSVSAQMIHQFASARSHRSAEPLDRLSNRELQILHLIGEGVSTRQAANLLHLSVKTVESHRQRIKRKLNLATATQLVRYAVLSLTRRGAPRES